MNDKHEEKNPASSILSIFIAIIAAIAIAAGLLFILERIDRFLSKRIRNYDRIKIFCGLLLNICGHLLLLIFLGYYMYYLLGYG